MSQVSSRRKRQAILAVFGVVLLVSAIGANIVVGADRTVMDAAFVKDGLESEGVYETMADDMVENVQDDNSTEVPQNLSGEGDGPPVDRMVEEVITPTYVRGQVERNVDGFYAYLGGERDELVLAFDLDPIKAGLAEEMEAWVVTTDVESIDSRMATLAANESSFEDRRASFKEEQLDRIQRETDEDHTRDELETIYEDDRDEIRERMIEEVENSTADAGPEPVQEAAVDYGTVGVDALVNDEMTYDEFLSREATAREDLAATVGEATRKRLDEQLPDSMDLTEDMDESAMQTVETMRTGYSIVGVLVFVLPFGAIAAAFAIGYVSRGRSNALWRVGGLVAVAGVVGFASSVFLSRLLPTVLNADPENPSEIAAAMLSIGRTVTGTIEAQSLLLVALGLALVVAGLGIRRELLPVADDPDVVELDESNAVETD